jgi:hypothetical protein
MHFRWGFRFCVRLAFAVSSICQPPTSVIARNSKLSSLCSRVMCESSLWCIKDEEVIAQNTEIVS